MGIQMQDLNPVEHQTKATFTPKHSIKGLATAQPPTPSASQPGVAPRPANPIVQKVHAKPAPVESGPDLLQEIDAEFSAPAEPAPELAAPASEADADVDTILKRYKGTPDEVAKQLAKSYKESEKRMRQLENEKKLLMQGQPQPTPQPQAPAPIFAQHASQGQVQVTPQFDYKKWGEKLLDDPAERAKEFESHLKGTLEQKLVEVAAPLYEEALENRLFRKFPDVVTEENLDVIKAMAHTEPGANRWEKITSAVQKYKQSMPTHQTQPMTPEMQSMQASVQSPTPQAKPTGEKKMWKESDIQKVMRDKIRTGEYQRDPRIRQRIDLAYREGRVLRGQ